MKPFALAATLLSIICACSVESGGGDEDTGGIDAGGPDGATIPRPPEADATAGPADLSEFCNQWNAIVCGHLYTCLTEEERAEQGLPATQGECVAAQAADCEGATSETYCDSGQVYAADQAMPCLTQFTAFTCELFLSPDHDAVLEANAPACSAMCQ